MEGEEAGATGTLEGASLLGELCAESWDAIIIGSGLGGLGAASTLAQLANYKCLVLEQHWTIGGMTHQFLRENKYWFSTGTHYVGQIMPGERMGTFMQFVTGGAVWDPLPDDFDVFCFGSDGGCFPQPTGEEAWRLRLESQFPTERAAIRRYFADIRKVFDFYGNHLGEKATRGLVRAAFRLLVGGRRRRAASFTAEEYMRRNFQDPRLRGLLLAIWGDHGLRPDQVTFMHHALITGNNFTGTYYPRLGPRHLAKATLPFIQAAGGRVLASAPVSEILLDAQGRASGVRAAIQGAEGELRSKLVISAVGAYATFRQLLKQPIHPCLEDKTMQSAGCGCAALYFGLDCDPAEVWGVKGENLWISSDYEHSSHSMYDPWSGKGPDYAFLTFPSLKEAYATAHWAEVCLFTDPRHYARWEHLPSSARGPEYEALKKRMLEDVLRYVEPWLPGFGSHVAYSEVGTPLTWRHFTGWPDGAMYGVPPTRRRVDHDAILRPETAIPGLFLAGTDANMFGVAGAAMGGVMAAGAILSPRLGFFGIYPQMQKMMAQPGWAAPAWPPDSVACRVESIHDEGSAARSITLRVPSEALERFAFSPGQFVTLVLDVDRDQVRRAYSISSLPRDLPLLSVAVKRIAGGRASGWLHDHLEEGQEVRVLAPMGEFCLEGGTKLQKNSSQGTKMSSPPAPFSDDHGDAAVQVQATRAPLPHLHLFLGAGSGVVPLVPMLEMALERGDCVAALLCHRSPYEAILQQRVARAVPAAGMLVLQTHYTRPGLSALLEEQHLSVADCAAARRSRCDAGAVLAWVERVLGTAEAAAAYRGGSGRATAYLCGPTDWMAMAAQALQASPLGLDPARHVRKEEFASAEERAFDFAGAGVECQPRSVDVVVLKSRATQGAGKQAVRVEGGQSLLAATAEAGLQVPYSCRGGSCKLCKVHLVQGSVLDLEDGLQCGERDVLACRVTPVADGVVVIAQEA